MIKIEVLENKTYFRKGMRLAGPIDLGCIQTSIVCIADEFQVEPSMILIAYIEHWFELNPELNDVDMELESPVELPPQIQL